MNKFTKMFEI